MLLCVATANGKEALLYLKSTEHSIPDFIFLDISMPGLSGRECLEEIKRHHRLKSAPVIMFTTSGNEVYYLLSVVLSQKWEFQ